MLYTDFFHVVAILYPNVSCEIFKKGMQFVRTSEDLPPGLVDFALFQGVFQFLSNINRVVVSIKFGVGGTHTHTHTHARAHTHVYIYIYIYTHTHTRKLYLGAGK